MFSCMKILISIHVRYPKNSDRPPDVTATAHLPGTSPRSTPRLTIDVRPRPGYSGMEVASSVFGLSEPIPCEVDDDFFDLAPDFARPIMLAAIRDAVRSRTRV